MFDHGGGSLVELQRDAGGGIEIEQIRERQLLALQHLRGAEPEWRVCRVPSRGLLGIFSVSKIFDLVQIHRQPRRHRRPGCARKSAIGGRKFREGTGNCGIVGGGVRKRLARQLEAKRCRRSFGPPDLGEHAIVIVGVDHDEHILKILRGRPHHAGSADIDFLDKRVQRDVRLRSGLHERIQIHHDEIDRHNLMPADGGHVAGVVAPGQNAAMHRRVQGLDPAVHDLGKSGDVGDSGHLQPGRFEGLRRTARRHHLVAQGHERPGERQQTGFIGDADERSGTIGSPGS